MVRSNDDSILHRFRDDTAFPLYVTACDVDKSFIFEKYSKNYKLRALFDLCKNI